MKPLLSLSGTLTAGVRFFAWAIRCAPLLLVPSAFGAVLRPLTVCEALAQSHNHEEIVIKAAVELFRHGTFLTEGIDGEPCPGWHKRLFTAPSFIPMAFFSLDGVHLTSSQLAQNRDLMLRLATLRSAGRTHTGPITLRGTVLRKPLPLIIRKGDGTYFGFGFYPDGGILAVLVVQSVLEGPTLR